MVKLSKRFKCTLDGYVFETWSQKPRCRKCGSLKTELSNESLAPEEQAKKNAALERFKKIGQNNLKPVSEPVKPVEPGLLTKESLLGGETMSEEKEETTNYQCECGRNVKQGQLFCSGCGQEMDW